MIVDGSTRAKTQRLREEWWEVEYEIMDTIAQSTHWPAIVRAAKALRTAKALRDSILRDIHPENTPCQVPPPSSGAE